MILALASVIPPVRAVHRQNSAGTSRSQPECGFLPACGGVILATKVFYFNILQISAAG
jgi:hypothetical protein